MGSYVLLPTINSKNKFYWIRIQTKFLIWLLLSLMKLNFDMEKFKYI